MGKFTDSLAAWSKGTANREAAALTTTRKKLPKPATPAQRTHAEALIRDGASALDVAFSTGMTEGQVRALKHDLGLTNPRPRKDKTA